MKFLKIIRNIKKVRELFILVLELLDYIRDNVKFDEGSIIHNKIDKIKIIVKELN